MCSTAAATLPTAPPPSCRDPARGRSARAPTHTRQVAAKRHAGHRLRETHQHAPRRRDTALPPGLVENIAHHFVVQPHGGSSPGRRPSRSRRHSSSCRQKKLVGSLEGGDRVPFTGQDSSKPEHLFGRTPEAVQRGQQERAGAGSLGCVEQVR